MNYTLTQAIDRTRNLSGELKAARTHEADCAADHLAKQRIAEIAAEAHERATGKCIELEQERADLSEHVAGLILKTGEPIDETELVQMLKPIMAPPEFESASSADDLAERLMARSEANMNGAYDEATR